MDGGRSKGFGFVGFSSPEAAIKALTEMNGQIVDGKALHVSLAQRKEERQAYLSNLYKQRMARPMPNPVPPPVPPFSFAAPDLQVSISTHLTCRTRLVCSVLNFRW